MLEIDAEGVSRVIVNFIKEYMEKCGRRKLVLGLSGGIDSAVMAKLAVMAAGNENVHAIFMPDVSTPLEDFEDARMMAKELDIDYKTIDLSPMIHFITNACGEMDEVALGNIKARLRMIFLYQAANSLGALVCGTSNKTEILLGYFTKYGDGGSDFMPIGDLYKTQVYMLAKHLGIPENIIEKPPTAGLWKGQTDEKEIGLPYGKVDAILYGIERKMDMESISELADVSVDEVKRIYAMVEKNEHKRRFPAIPKIGFRTVGIDWRFPLKL